MMERTSKDDEDGYKWAMKANILRTEDTESWKKRRAIPLSDITERTRLTQTGILSSDDSRIRIMASLVPDEIIYNIGDYSKRDLDACLLFGDVSGFTDLCEKYNKSGKGGPSRLTQVLNAYIGAMVQEILSHNGDVLKFSGDAFIAMWKETDHLSLRDAVHEAIDCALVIQKTYGTYQTDVEVIVRVKLAVACGHLKFSLVGDEDNSHYLMVGQPIQDIKTAESKSSAGEIVISTRVSHHISANEYLIDMLPDGIHAKVLGVGPNWRNIQRHYENKSVESYSILSANHEESAEDIDTSVYGISSRPSEQDEDQKIISKIVTDQYALRPAVNHAARQKIKDELRRFIIAPVMHGIDAEEPIEYLTEIRQVCILFININVSTSIKDYKGIDVAHKVYLTVCNLVKNKYGCVNKISNFDKDLMLLVIFGLRGFKHELESQIALKCAIKCYAQLTSMEHILGVGTAVTTGKCYCGAFGHTLRREYTVIGIVVNKAARLMLAYPDKVVCDRETFLHSKIESRNFILQEYRPLKGILNPGPVYEFKGVQKFQDQLLEINRLPLLGREQEIDLYRKLFKRAQQLSKTKPQDLFSNTLIFQGAFRQGKTRLLQEILFVTQENVPIQTYLFSAFDYDVPYRAIQLIFFRFLKIEANSNETVKQKRIESCLNKPENKEFLCFLNVIFNVKFPISTAYKTMDKEKKYKTLQMVFKQMCKEIFNKFMVLVIDDSQYIDDESWLLLNVLVDLNLVFIVATMGTEAISTFVMEVLKNSKIKIVELKAINKWFHVGLACQILNVDGIPPELEKTIQLKSNGNPGWVESFLVSLMQSQGAKIVDVTRGHAYASGIVIPPLYMTMRLSNEEIALWVEIMEERKMSVKEDKMSTRWKMFIDSCRESFPDLHVARVFDDLIRKSDIIKICTLNASFNLEDVDPELVLDVIILKTFDALTSYEQLLLKCSAILGDVFPRDMLLYIMASSAIRITALAVKKLFEIHVLSCARGNFTEGGLTFKERLNNPNEDLSVRCDCKGLLIDESCEDLPKYASCGYLRFRSSEFRETTYNLLTDNQKREFHERAIRYLEKETRRCRSCGNGYFGRHLGAGRLDSNLRSKRRERKKSTFTETSSIGETYRGSKILHGSSFATFDSLQSGGISIGKSRDIFKQRESLMFQPELYSLESHRGGSVISAELGFQVIRKLKDNFNLIRNFSATDYSQCTCLLVLNTMYSQLIEHCKGAGLAEKIMNVTVEYAYVCIENKNTPQAIKMLEEALQLLEGPMKEQIELDWMLDLRKGKLFTLLGQARMQIEDDDAYEYFMGALKCYGVQFPLSSSSQSILKHALKIKLNFKYLLGIDTTVKKVDDEVAEYNNNVSECLGCLCRYFVKKSKWHEAELAAAWSLSRAVETETDFEKLCISFGNLINIESTLGNHKFVITLEVFSLRICHKKRSYIELEEIKAVAFLYYSICRGRLIRAEIEKFLHIGHVVWRLASSSQTEALVFRILPVLAYIVLMRRQITECVQLIQEIQFIIENDTDNSEKSWYYDMCVVVHLETGLTVEHFSKCINFMQEEGLEITTRDPDGKRQLIVCIWLWQIRNKNWEAAMVWQKNAWEFDIKKLGENVPNLITCLYLLEGLIIYLSHKMDKKNLKSIQRTNVKINALLESLDKAGKICKLIKPRLYHMKGYYRIVKYNDYKGALKLLRKGKTYAEENLNDIEIQYIKHSEMAWLKKLTREEIDSWKDHSDEDNLIGVSDPDYNEKICQFSLPIPIYV